ncbi:MAG: hypothetical protein WAU32_13045 [Thermoanaerobaculia bacterium]
MTVAIVIAIAGAILAIQLLLPPIVGLADNGDFGRVMEWVGLRYPTDSREDNFVSWMLPKLAFAQSWRPNAFLTSETPLAAVAVLASRTFSDGGYFDIRVLGSLHLILLLLAVGAIVWTCRDLSPVTQGVTAALLIFIFTDVGYAAPLNSLYSQTASFLFLMLTVSVAAMAIRSGRLHGLLLVGYFLCATLFVCSKPQESLQGPLLAAFALCAAGTRFQRWWRQPAVWLALALCLISISCYRLTPKWLRPVAVYNTLFRELLPNSPDPSRDLAELGLDPALVRYMNSDPYPPESPLHDPSFRAGLFAKYDYQALLGFYTRHPRRLLFLIQRGAQSALHLRPLVLGNFPKTRGLPAGAMASHFAWWSDLRLNLAPVSSLWLSLLFGGTLVASGIGYHRDSKRGRLFRQALVFLAAMACVEFLVATLADDIGDIARHLFVFHACCDLLLIANAGWLTESLVKRIRRVRSPDAFGAPA